MNRRHGCERGNSDSADTGRQVSFFLFFRPTPTNGFRKTELQNKIVHLTSRQNCVAAFAQSCGDGLAASSTASCALSNTASPTARSRRRPSGQEKRAAYLSYTHEPPACKRSHVRSREDQLTLRGAAAILRDFRKDAAMLGRSSLGSRPSCLPIHTSRCPRCRG